MPDQAAQRISRELFLASIGGSLEVESWVTDRLTGILEEEEAAAGECVFAAGDPADHLYFLRQGRIELLRDGKSVETFEGPRAFGTFDHLLERTRPVSAFARTPLQLLRVPGEAWLELLEDSFELASASLRGLGVAVAALEERLWASGRQLEPPAPLLFERSGHQLDIVERLALLMRTPLVRGAGVQSVSDLAMACDEVTFAAGEALFERSVPGKRVFVLIDGGVVATREGPSVSWRGGSGEMVCGAASLGEKYLEWEARAATRTRALSFGMDDWFDVMEENFEMVHATLVALAKEHERLSGESARSSTQQGRS